MPMKVCFFKDSEVRDLACERIDEKWGNIEGAAEDYAQKNQNDKVTDITFIEDIFVFMWKQSEKESIQLFQMDRFLLLHQILQQELVNQKDMKETCIVHKRESEEALCLHK